MPRRKIEILLRRSIECEKLSLAAGDVSIRNKCAELAMEYRGLAGETESRYRGRIGRLSPVERGSQSNFRS